MPDPDIPTSHLLVDHDFAAPSAPPPGERPAVRQLVRTGPDRTDPGHLAEDDEWARIVADAEGGASS